MEFGDSNPADQVQQMSKDEIRVPGSRAQHYLGRNLFYKLFRYVLHSDCGLGLFARSLFGRVDLDFDSTESSPSALPMPIPYPEAFRKGWTAAPREIARKRAVNCICLALDYLHLGRPSKLPSSCLVGNPLNKTQWEAVGRFENFLDAWLDCEDIGPTEMGRSASKVESMEDAIRELTAVAKKVKDESSASYFPVGRDERAGASGTADSGEVVGAIEHAPFSTFKPVDPARLTFIGEPSFNPVPFLDPASVAVYTQPLTCSKDPATFEGKVPFVQVHCSPDQKMKLFNLLDNSRRLALHNASTVRPRFCSGLFSVVKSLEKDRLILDSRPANLLEIPQQRWIRSLASAESLCRLQLRPDQLLTASGNDLRDFYYLFSVSEERSKRNILAGPVKREEVEHLRCFHSGLSSDEPIYGSLCTLAMGDTQAVSLAQTCHVGLALQSNIATAETLLTLSGPVPRGNLAVGIVIDDFVSIAKIGAGFKGASEGAKLADLIQDKYKSVGLIPHEEKAFRDSQTASFWGADLDGNRGLVRGALRRSIPLVGLILEIVKLGFCSVELLEVVSGSLVSLLLFRRRLLCLMDCIFQGVRGREKNMLVRLSRKLKSELLLLSILLPLAATNLRAEVAPFVAASDASNWGEAGVVARVDWRISSELYRHVLRKSVWTKLLNPGAAWERSHGLLDPLLELPDPEQSYSFNPLWTVLARSLTYKLLYKKSATGSRHINIGELRAFLTAEKKLAVKYPCTRGLYGVDSQVVLGCVVKGRSASPALNREMAKSLGSVLFYDVYSEVMYYRSADNPADDPTRGAALRGPRLPFPEWLSEIALDRYDAFDSWLTRHGISDYELTGLPPTGELTQLQNCCQVMEPDSLDEANPHNACFEETVESEHVDQEANSSSSKELLPINASPKARTAVPWTHVLETAGASPQQAEPSTLAPDGAAPSFKSWFGNLGKEESAEVQSLLSEFSKDQVESADKNLAWPPCDYGFLDLYSGEKGVAKELARLTGRWCLTFEILHDASEDLDKVSLRRKIHRLCELGAFSGWGAAPVCASFSVAVTPPVRSREHPYGKPNLTANMEKKVHLGNSSAKWLLSLVVLSLKIGLWFWIENPDLSWFFRLPEWIRLLETFSPRIGFWRLDFCRFGKKWRKRTKVLTNTLLSGKLTLCTRDHDHIPLRGRSSYHRRSWTAVAQPYPDALCTNLALSLAMETGCVVKRDFDPGSCARCGTLRIGEADNPGPRHYRANVLLEDVQRLEAKTVAMQGRFWNWFCKWTHENLSPGAAESLRRNPLMLCVLLKEFGNHLFSTGKTLHVFRHLVVYVQKHFLETKQFMSMNWEMIERWEVLEPPVHRTPIPGSVLRAMVCISWMLGWHRFSGTLCLSFFGITRPGEILKAIRRDLLFPSDLLTPDSGQIFLRVGEPKSRRRGKGKVQHAVVQNVAVIGFLEKIFSRLAYDEHLYPISSGSFRRRWDAILTILAFGSDVKLSPGSLRGGGAVEAYRSGIALDKLLWRMRLKSLQTLEHYLQEVACDTLLVDLSQEAR